MEPDEVLMRRATYRLIGAALEVLNTIGHGLHEKPYENALVVELTALKIPCEQQKRYPVFYKSVQVTEYVPDLIAFGSVIIDTKVIDHITDHERGQMLNYLRITGCQIGLILNFKRAKLEWVRVILSEHPR
jgi:GxxExxY protein